MQDPKLGSSNNKQYSCHGSILEHTFAIIERSLFSVELIASILQLQ